MFPSAAMATAPVPRSEMPTTRWSLIAQVRDPDGGRARAALEELCRAYHYPLYSLLRRMGLGHHDADDVLHDFLCKLLRQESFGVAEAEKGRLRTFLRVALMNYLNTWHRQRNRRAQRETSLEALTLLEEAEERFALEEEGHEESPDRLYDRQWAQELLARVLRRLRQRYAARGHEAVFEALRPVLLSGGSLVGHDGVGMAAKLGMSPVALRTALRRLLDKYREALREEILSTVTDEAMAREECEALMAAMKGTAG